MTEEPKKTKRVNVRLDAERERAVAELAEEKGVTTSEIIRNALDRVIHDSAESPLPSGG